MLTIEWVQVYEKMCSACVEAGAALRLGWSLTSLRSPGYSARNVSHQRGRSVYVPVLLISRLFAYISAEVRANFASIP
jgi:hypothetical protein